MITFGLVAEGKTDIAVLDNILVGYFNDLAGERIEVRPLQPNVDATDSFGNWYNALNYCKSNDFKEAFGFLDYVIVQVDTDISEDLGILRIGENQKAELATFVQSIQSKIIDDYIGRKFYEAHQDQIIFSITVHSIECWLLPLYANGKKTEKLLNCLQALNSALGKKQPKLIINPDNKEVRKYDALSRPYLKQKELKKCYSKNPSLKLFIETLEEKFQAFAK